MKLLKDILRKALREQFNLYDGKSYIKFTHPRQSIPIVDSLCLFFLLKKIHSDFTRTLCYFLGNI